MLRIHLHYVAVFKDGTIVGHISRKFPQHAPCFCFKWARCCARPPSLSASQWMCHKVACEFCALWSSLELLKTLQRLKKLLTGASGTSSSTNECNSPWWQSPTLEIGRQLLCCHVEMHVAPFKLVAQLHPWRMLPWKVPRMCLPYAPSCLHSEWYQGLVLKGPFGCSNTSAGLNYCWVNEKMVEEMFAR